MFRRFLNQPVWVRVIRGFVLAGVLVAIMVYTPTPYLLLAPGRAVSAATIISIRDAKTYPSKGTLLMTTVLSEPASVLYLLYGLIDPAATLTRRPDGLVGEQAQAPSEAGQMQLSQYFSTRVALEKLGYQVQGKYLGLRVLGLREGSPNGETLRGGDLIVGLAGQKMPSLERFISLLDAQTAGKTVEALVTRGKGTEKVALMVKEMDGRKRVGAALRPEYSSVELPLEVIFHSGNTLGASGGLVFALEIYDQLTPQDITKGRIIAVTGTLTPSGRVGGIEGIPFKLVAAERAGATVFVVPKENYAEIEKEPTAMRILPVESFEEALDALE